MTQAIRDELELPLDPHENLVAKNGRRQTVCNSIRLAREVRTLLDPIECKRISVACTRQARMRCKTFVPKIFKHNPHEKILIETMSSDGDPLAVPIGHAADFSQIPLDLSARRLSVASIPPPSQARQAERERCSRAEITSEQ